MPVNLTAPVASSLHPVAGVRIGVAEAGVRKANRKDLTVFLLDEGASVGGVFTRNRFCAAPVQICRERLTAGAAVRAIVVNTGNANAGTGEDGLARARQTCEALAAQLKLQPDQVLPFSTGVIMEPLPVDRIVAGLPAAITDAQPAHWARAAEGIMTTDTVPKAASAKAMVGGVEVTITGISKGAGMIRPNMATMLGFLATDARVDAAHARQAGQRIGALGGADAARHRQPLVAAGAVWRRRAGVPALQRRRGRTQDHLGARQLAAVQRQVARRIARAFLLLVARVVLFIDHDQLEPGQ